MEHPHIKLLQACIDLEIQEQEKRYQLDQDHSLRQLKSIGVALHPIAITRRGYGYADYPEISFRLPFPADTSAFKDGAAIECFFENETPIKGIVTSIDGSKGEFRLFSPDFPDWIEEKGIGIKLAPDHRTSEIMKRTLEELPQRKGLFQLFENIHGNQSFGQKKQISNHLPWSNQALNESQQEAVKGIVENDGLLIVHGPPGTGKTTTLIEGILHLIAKEEKIVVSAPSNTAVDHLAKGLIQKGVNVLRVGNVAKVDEDIFPYTTEGKMIQGKQQQEIKKLKIRAEELRKMAGQYKRHFGKAEREQRNLLFREVKNIRNEIKSLRKYYENQLFEQASVILGTPIGLDDFLSANIQFDTLILDEAGQCIEPLAWVIFPYAKKWVLAGDHLQLPPTILSEKAAKAGFSKSILEAAFQNCQAVYFLNIQYRMREAIAGFSSGYFYDNQLLSPEHLKNIEEHVLYYDTAGAGFEEKAGEDGGSLINEGEVDVIEKLIQIEKIPLAQLAIISPYSGQVELLKQRFGNTVRISTIDSFQGQEKEIIILSLVRSNEDAVIGFLSDYRRMNVAMTRAKEKLYIVADSATIGNDSFYAQFLTYVEQINGYKSVWEIMYE